MTAGVLVLALVTGVLGALCAAADGALMRHDSGTALSGSGRVAAILEHGERAHRALLFGRLAMHLATGALLAAALRLATRPPVETVPLGVAVALAIVFVAEAVPRASGEVAGERLLVRLARFVGGVGVVLAPVVAAGERFDRLLHRVFPPSEGDAERETTPEQFLEVVEATADVPRDQRAILQGVFSLGDTEVAQVMVPRIDIVGIEQGLPWSEVLDRVRRAEHSRLPVFDETLDHIVGILYAKDLLPAVVDDRPPSDGWLSLVRPPVYIPEGKAIDAQLRDFKASRSHIAIVVDEYGGTAGLLTIEDILEEIVGEIRDEHDREELAVQAEEGCRFWVPGRMSLDDLSEVLKTSFERPDVATVGGLVFSELGHVPRAGEEFTLHGFRIVVERVQRRRVERVYFERLEQPAGWAT